MDRGACWATVCGVTESDTTETSKTLLMWGICGRGYRTQHWETWSMSASQWSITTLSTGTVLSYSVSSRYLPRVSTAPVFKSPWLMKE